MYVWCAYIYIVARGEEVGRQVGRRLAAGLHHPGDGARIALAADQEDSPLQSKRSSRFYPFQKYLRLLVLSFHCTCFIAFISFALFIVSQFILMDVIIIYIDKFPPTTRTSLFIALSFATLNCIKLQHVSLYVNHMRS